MDFFSSAWSWVTGSSTSSTLARLALMGYASKLLSKSLENNNTKPDKGVRQQLNPSTENIIPVLYGEAFFGGNITDARISTDFKKMTYCLTIAETTGTLTSTGQASAYQFKDVYFNSNRVIFKSDGITVDYTLDADGNQDISARDLIKVYFYRGQTGIQPYGHSGTTPPSYTVMPGWTQATHPMTDLLYAIVEVTYNATQNINGLPDCVWHITNTMTKPGDVLLDYMKNTRYGARLSDSDIDTASFVALNTYADTGFSYTDINNQTVTSALTINGVIDPGQTLLSNMTAIADNTGSWLTYDIYSGKWVCIINKAETPSVTITDSNIIGEISISGTSLTQLDNKVNVQYLNSDIRDKTDFVKISIPSGELYPNEPVNILEINLPYVNKQVVAAKIGLLQLKQARVDKIISFKTDFSYLQLRAGTVIGITSDVYGYVNKPFRIITVQEQEQAGGDLLIEFKCLEYKDTVYDYNISQYAVETDNGILSIGSIGKPNTPIITKQELSNIPTIVAEARVPSGVVSEIEFWLTRDINIQNDSARNYTLIGRYANADGSLLTEDTAVSLVCQGLEKGDFIIKCRGVNSFKSGPFSDTTGIINYVPDVVANSIDINAQLRNSVGGLAALLSVGELLKSVDDLLGGQVGKTIIEGVLDTLFPDRISTTTDVPGLLLEDQAYTSQFAGTINNLNNVSIDELMDVDTTTIAPSTGDSLIWDGSMWVPSSGTSQGSGSIAAWGRLTLTSADQISIDNSFGINTDVQYLNTESGSIKSVLIEFATEQTGPGYVVLATKGTNLDTKSAAKSYDVFAQTSKSFCLNLSGAAAGDVIHFTVIGQGGLGPCLLTSTARYPADRATYLDPLSDGPGDLHPPRDNPDTVPIDFRPYMEFSVGTIYSLTKGSGNVKLYRSNGVLDQQLAAVGIIIEGNRVSFPFNPLDYGTDYYILMDKGVVRGTAEKGETCYSDAITSPQKWNFHTLPKNAPAPVVKPSELPSPSSSNTVAAPGFLPVPAKCQTLELVRYETQSKIKTSNNQKVDIQSNIKLHYNVNIKLGTIGSITIYKKNGSVWQTFNISHTFNQNRVSELLWIENNDTLVINSTVDFSPDTEYYLLMTANCVYNECGLVGNKQISNTTQIVWKTDAGPKPEGTTPPPAGESINRLGVSLPYDRPVTKGTGKMRVYDSNNNLVAEVPATDSSIKVN